MTLAGVAIGLGASLIFTRVFSSFSRLLYRVSADDPATVILASLVLTFAAALACYVPALRATRVVPTAALRQE